VGTLTDEGTPAAAHAVQSDDSEESAPVDGQPRLVRRFFVKTDESGRFAIPRVMPGRLKLVKWVPNGVDRRIWPVPLATLDVKPDATYRLDLGRRGARAQGRLPLQAGADWMVRKAEVVPKGSGGFPLGVEVLPDARFVAQDLPAGEYALRIAIHEPPPEASCGWGRLLGEFKSEFSVPAGSKADSPPIDLGTLLPDKVAGTRIQVGDAAPDFALKTLDGREATLAGMNGKIVLLDFWATWCAPCIEEMPNIRAVLERFGTDPRFMIVGISLDERSSDVTRMAKSLNMTWSQVVVGPDAGVVSAYGATAIPATFLIGPDGRILARDLRGEATAKAVAEALGR
jgi:peroxiredoxin